MYTLAKTMPSYSCIVSENTSVFSILFSAALRVTETECYCWKVVLVGHTLVLIDFHQTFVDKNGSSTLVLVLITKVLGSASST